MRVYGRLSQPRGTYSLCRPPCNDRATQGYQVGNSALQFEIRVRISVGQPTSAAAASNTTAASNATQPARLEDELLKLSPSVPVAVSDNKLARVSLLGDLATYEQTTVLRWGTGSSAQQPRRSCQMQGPAGAVSAA